ncbi:MAG TPA: DUF4062 domain-containing protein [Solirubrobacteraceae bacterium]
MPLIVDRSQSPPPLDWEALRAWAQGHTVFVSSEMKYLAGERRALADALREIGLNVVMFEDLGGREDDAEIAYLDGVARSDIYLAVIADRYGRMLANGRSPTHEEYREARRLGQRITVWVATDGSGRQGDARDFVAELQQFHTTGGYADTSSLIESVLGRLREIAAEEDVPWAKLGNVVFRASSIEDDGQRLLIAMKSRDRDVLQALQAMRPHAMRSAERVPVTFGDRSGIAQVTEVGAQSSSASLTELRIWADVQWPDGRRPGLAATVNGVSFEEQIQAGLAAGLFGEPLPQQLGMLASTVESSDPLAALDALNVPYAIYEPVARLLITERLITVGAVTRVEVAVGPPRAGRRAISVAWQDAKVYVNREPEHHDIAGERSAVA